MTCPGCNRMVRHGVTADFRLHGCCDARVGRNCSTPLNDRALEIYNEQPQEGRHHLATSVGNTHTHTLHLSLKNRCLRGRFAVAQRSAHSFLHCEMQSGIAFCICIMCGNVSRPDVAIRSHLRSSRIHDLLSDHLLSDFLLSQIRSDVIRRSTT